MCIICAHPLPTRIQWWWHGEKERDDGIDQTNINQSCLAEQFTLVWVRRNQSHVNILKIKTSFLCLGKRR